MSIEISAEKRTIYLQKRITEIQTILGSHDLDLGRVHTLLHQLQGSSPTFGFSELIEPVTDMQRTLDTETNDTIKIKEMLASLVQQLDQSRQAVREPIYI